MPDLRLAPDPEAPSGPKLAELSDDELMALTVAGRQDAFGALVRRHEQRVRRFLSRITGLAWPGPIGPI